MKLAAARVGESLSIRSRHLDFSLYPMIKTNRRWGIHSMLYAADPWAVIAGSAAEAITSAPERAAASSFVRQAREYFSAAERAQSIETKPLLYYYSFLNLAKAIAMTRGRDGLVGKVSHGVAVVGGSGHSPTTSKLELSRSSALPGGPKSAVDELHLALENAPVTAGHYNLSEIIAQSVIGHRMWREAFATPRVERFIPIDSVRFRHNPVDHNVWLDMLVSRGTLKARGRSLDVVLRESGLQATFRGVRDLDPAIAAEFHVLEQSTPEVYTGRAADVVVDTVSAARHHLWQTITSTPPYRRFYLYLAPAAERRLPQWLSTYSTLFWLGSLTRYQPVELLDLLNGKYGPFFHKFLETQPKQLLYILASEAKRQNVTRAAVV
jgi:hypothetical protein